MTEINYKFIVGTFLCLVHVYWSQADTTADHFSEELFISPLPTGHIYLHFKFVTSTPLLSHYAHTDYFPKPVIDILEKHSVEELHVRLTQGVFRHYKWGYPILSAPTGGEVWAWFMEDSPGIPEQWRGLTNSLAGLLCATFNDISSANSMSPKWNFRPEGLSNLQSAGNSSLLRYSMLPRENLCTENLTPWKKLLPCSDRAGLGRLLNAIKLLSGHYLSLSLDVRAVCADTNCQKKRQEIAMTVTSVVEPGSVLDSNKQSWSIKDLLEVELDSGCPLAQTSLIHVDQSTQGKTVFWPTPSFFLTGSKSAKTAAVYDLKNEQTWEKGRVLGGKAVSELEYSQPTKPIISAHRFVSGYGQQSGGIRCLISNSHATSPITVLYLEMLPWYLRTYFHTIRVQTPNGQTIPLIKSHLVPGRDRLLPHHIELIFQIPPGSTVEFAVDFDFTLLKWTEYPPDAHRGFDVPPAVISAKLPTDLCGDFIFPANFSQLHRSEADFCFLRLYTESLLVSLPTPDFSMPYNVICMTCTVLALAFGPIHALTTKNFKLSDPAKNPTVLQKVKRKGKELLGRWKKTPVVEQTEVKSEE